MIRIPIEPGRSRPGRSGSRSKPANATRRVEVYSQVLRFGREPVYVRAAELPPQLADNPHLRIETVDSAPPDMEVIELLKPERVQGPISPSGAATTRKRG